MTAQPGDTYTLQVIQVQVIEDLGDAVLVQWVDPLTHTNSTMRFSKSTFGIIEANFTLTGGVVLPSPEGWKTPKSWEDRGYRQDYE